MAKQALSIRFFWGPRRQSRRSCADRISRFIVSLQDIAPIFRANWFLAGEQPDDPRNRPVKLSKVSLDSVLKKGTFKTDPAIGHPRVPIRDLGFSVWLASDGYQRVLLQVHCGAYTKFVHNSLNLSMPDTGVAGNQVFRVSALTELFRQVIDCWDPDVGQVWSVQLSDAIEEQPGDLQAGWLTYVAHRVKQLPKLDKRFHKVRVRNVGEIVMATKQRFNIDNPYHVNRVKSLARILNEKSD